MELVHCSLNTPRGFLPSQALKQAGGPSKQIFPQSRVVHSPGRRQHHLPVVGSSPDRLFALRLNRKCQQFCSFQNHSPSSITDTFLLHWRDHLFYAFPPFLLVHKVQKGRNVNHLDSARLGPPTLVHNVPGTVGVATPITLSLVPDLMKTVTPNVETMAAPSRGTLGSGAGEKATSAATWPICL